MKTDRKPEDWTGPILGAMANALETDRKLKALLRFLVRERRHPDCGPQKFRVAVEGTRPWGEGGRGYATREEAEQALVARALEAEKGMNPWQ